MSIEVERASLMNRDDVRNLVAEVIEQYASHGDTSTNTMKPGNELTLSIFSELEYGLRMRTASGAPAVQRMPIEITANGYLEFKKTLPIWVADMLIIRRGALEQALPLCNPPGIIKLDKADDVLAVKLRDSSETVRLVTVVTHVSRTYSPPGSAS